MSGAQQRPVEASSSRTRSRSPERFDRNVRQKIDREAFAPPLNRTHETEYHGDEEFDTALAHVIYDSPEHPIYKRHVDYVLHRMCTNLPDAMSHPLASLQKISSEGAAASEAKQAAAKQLLTERWLGKLLEHVGEMMVTTDQEGVVVENDLGRHRLQLKVVPIVQVDDAQTVVSEGSRVPGDIGEDIDDGDEEDTDDEGAVGNNDDTENSGGSSTDFCSDDDNDGESDDGSSDEQPEDSSQDGSMTDSDTEQEDSGVDVPSRLPPYPAGEAQIFVCKKVPNTIKFGVLLEQLALVSSQSHRSRKPRYYVMKSRKGMEHGKNACVVIILDRLCRTPGFTVKYKKLDLRFLAYLGGAKCDFCGRGHLLIDCAKLALLYPDGSHQDKAAFMSKRPRLLGTLQR